jgi:hypothetical protein
MEVKKRKRDKEKTERKKKGKQKESARCKKESNGDEGGVVREWHSGGSLRQLMLPR